MSVAGTAQTKTRGRRQRARDPEELQALEEAMQASRKRLVTAIRSEWEEFVSTEAHRDESGQLVWSERLIRSLADTGLATLRYLAEGGDREAARLLVDRLLGEPDLPWSEKVKTLTAEQAMGQIEELLGKKRFTDVTLDGILLALSTPPPPELGGGNR